MVENQQDLDLEFIEQDHNTVRIRMDNKINGPDVWDTVIDHDGRIISDKNCRFENIRIIGARLSCLEYELEYHFYHGGSERVNGFMSQNGWYQFEFPRAVYPWILENRRRVWPARQRQSSLTYDSVYFGDNENTHVKHLLDECRILLDRF